MADSLFMEMNGINRSFDQTRERIVVDHTMLQWIRSVNGKGAPYETPIFKASRRDRNQSEKNTGHVSGDPLGESEYQSFCFVPA